MKSGLVVLSEPENLCYPYMESIQSMLSVVDEVVVVWNPLVEDGSRTGVEKLGIRIVQAAFDLEEYGWISYAIARTTGYQACNGGTVVMFDADGVLHEQEVEPLKERLQQFDQQAETHPYAYWRKYRFYKPTFYHDQNKHSGIYSKRILGDRFDFYRGRKGAPNLKHLKENETSKQFNINIFGYEHIWDTKEILLKKILRYKKMKTRLYNETLKTDEEYYQEYISELISKMNEKGKEMDINLQPKIIQDKLRSVKKEHFGYAWFQ